MKDANRSWCARGGTLGILLLAASCAQPPRATGPAPATAPADPAAAPAPAQAVHHLDAPPALGNASSPPPRIVRGVVTALLMEPSSRGEIFRGFTLQSTGPINGGTGQTAVATFVGTYTNRTVASRDGRVAPNIGDELILKGRPAYFSGRPALAEPFVLKVVRQGVDLAQAAPAFDAQPPAALAEAAAYWSARHAQRCRIPAGATVMGAHVGGAEMPNSFITLLRGDHPLQARPDAYARRVFRDAHPLDDNPDALADNGNGFRLALADGGVKAAAGNPAATLPAVRTFDRLAEDLEGVVLWTGSGYHIHPVHTPAFTRGPPPDQNEPPAVARTRAQLRIATFNLENLYDFRDDPFDNRDFRQGSQEGAGGAPGRLENYVPASDADYRRHLQGLAAQIVQDLDSPDALMVQEAEDQDIGYMREGRLETDYVNNRDGRLDGLEELAAEIVRAGGPLYLPVADRAGADDRGIICAFLYRQDRLRLADIAADHAVLSGAVRTPGGKPLVAFQGGPANPRALNAPNADGTGLVIARAVQVACFERVSGADIAVPAGQQLYLLVNHYKSGPGEFVAERMAQAQLTADIASAILAAEPDAWVVAGGDLNTFPRPDEPTPAQPADQLGALYNAGLANLYDSQLQRHPASAYSYVFEGQAQTLDQLFVSTNLLARLADVRPLHINADYSPDPATPNRRVSDHDPVVAAFE